DTLTGSVTAQSEDTVTLDHPALGSIAIPAAQVASISAAEDQATEPSATPQTPGDTDADSSQTSATSAVAAGSAPVTALNEADDPFELEPRGLFGTPFLAGWDNSLAIGVTGSSGNSDTLSIN